VDHFATTSVLVGNSLQVAFTLQRFLIQSLTSLADSTVVVVVVVVVSVVVVGTARDTGGRHQRLGREAVSIVVLFVGSRRSVFGTSAVGKDASVDARRGTVSTNVVHLVCAVSIVVIVLPSLLVHGTALRKFVDVHSLFSFLSFGAKVQALVHQTLVLAILLIVVILIVLVLVVVVLAIGIIVGIVVTILALVFTVVLSGLTFGFVGLALCFLECFDEFSHFNDVFSSIATTSTAVVGTQSKFGDEVAADTLFAFKGRNGDTSIKLEGRLSHPRAVVTWKIEEQC
jgi:hypothetical protein